MAVSGRRREQWWAENPEATREQFAAWLAQEEARVSGVSQADDLARAVMSALGFGSRGFTGSANNLYSELRSAAARGTTREALIQMGRTRMADPSFSTDSTGGGGGGYESTPPDSADPARRIQPVGAPVDIGNGPSNGPNLGLIWPGYIDLNPNVEEQYAQWRDEVRAGWDGAGADPGLDMAAFRQHLIGTLGAPDPGEPDPTRSIQPVGSVEDLPSTPPGTLPDSGNRPDPNTGVVGGPASGPGVRPFAEALAGGIENMTPAEVGFYFSFLGNKEQSELASSNTVRALGLDPNTGNPLSEFLKGLPGPLAELLANVDVVRNGGTQSGLGNLQSTLSTLRSGQMSPFADYSAAKSFLNQAGTLRAPGATPNAQQAGLNTELNDPTNAFRFFNNAIGGTLSPFISRYSRQAFQPLYERFQNQVAGKPAGDPATDFFRFLLQGA